MSIERELLVMAQKIQDECMSHNNNCDDCPLVHNCIIPEPYTWKIPDPPPEPTERMRIEWLRMLPDEEMLDAVNHIGPHSLFPWHEVVSLGQFRKDVGLDEWNNRVDE